MVKNKQKRIKMNTYISKNFTFNSVSPCERLVSSKLSCPLCTFRVSPCERLVRRPT